MRIWAPWAITDATGAFELSWNLEGRFYVSNYADGAAGTCGGAADGRASDTHEKTRPQGGPET